MIGHETPVAKTEPAREHTSTPGACPHNPHGHTVHGPTADQLAKVARWLRLLIDHDQLVELRALGMTDVPPITLRDGTTREPVYAGMFRGTELDALAREVLALSGRCRGVYYTLNPLRPERFGKQAPRIQRATKKSQAHDTDICRRTRLLIDVDAVRTVSDAPASDAEHTAALDHARAVREYLTGRGWPAPALLDSGNGAQLIYRVDLPATDEATDLVRRVLRGLATLDGPGGRVDVSVYNLSRIARAPGARNLKGTATADRSHRRAVMLDAPAELLTVSADLLAAVADPAPAVAPPVRDMSAGQPTRSFAAAGGAGDLDTRIARYMAEIPAAVSGQGGHKQTLKAAIALVRGFDLSPDAAYPHLANWNEGCTPPWCEGDLRRKLDEAARSNTPARYILDRGDRPSSLTRVAKITPDEEKILARLLASAPLETIEPDDLSDIRALSDGPAYCTTHEGFACGAVGPFGRCACAILPLPRPAVSASELRVYQDSQQNTDTRNSDALRELIGPPPSDRYCSRPITRFAVGISERTCGHDAAFQLGCGRWVCDVCRERKTFKVKKEQVPIVSGHATHIWEGTLAEWEATRKRMDRADVERTHYAILQPLDRLAVVVAVSTDADAVPASVGIRRVTGMEAAAFFARAVDAIPDAEEGVRAKRFRPGFGWGDLDPPVLTASAGDERPHVVPEQHWRFIDGAARCRVSQLPGLLATYGVDCNTDTMIDARRGGPVERTAVWEAPSSLRHEIRSQIVAPPRINRRSVIELNREAVPMLASLRAQYHGREHEANELLRCLLA